MKPDLILIGGGGHCKSCIDVIEQENRFRIAGIVDLPERLGEKIFDYNIIACDKDLPDLVKKYSHFFITLGQIKTPTRREKLFEQLKMLGLTLPVIISPRAYVSCYASVGEGTIVMHDAFVNAAAKVGKNCIINTKALIEHDSIVEDYCHISTGAVINGNAKIRSQSFLGSNSVTSEGIEIGENSLIGCGLRITESLQKQTFLKNCC
jgi:sugar O-acyltransferase (sialic acid O-acetyltransferase NeuD family)